MRGNGSGKLKDEHKAFLVRRLAAFDTPKQAAEALKAEFRAEITPQGAEAYDPSKRAGRALSERWRALFQTSRDRFLEKLEEIPATHKAVRVKKLANAADTFEARGNYIAMADMLERIAKEMGNVHTNRREITGKDGGAIEYRDVDLMTRDELLAELNSLLGTDEPPTLTTAVTVATSVDATKH